jgi:hypothetical protein
MFNEIKPQGRLSNIEIEALSLIFMLRSTTLGQTVQFEKRQWLHLPVIDCCIRSLFVFFKV